MELEDNYPVRRIELEARYDSSGDEIATGICPVKDYRRSKKANMPTGTSDCTTLGWYSVSILK
jgi:hypothetical protein